MKRVYRMRSVHVLACLYGCGRLTVAGLWQMVFVCDRCRLLYPHGPMTAAEVIARTRSL